MKLQASQFVLFSLYLVSSVKSGVPSWGQGQKGEGSTLTGVQRVLAVLWLSCLLDIHSYSHKINCVRKSGPSHLDVPLSLEKAHQIPPVVDENHTQVWLEQQQLFFFLQTIINIPWTRNLLMRISGSASRKCFLETTNATLFSNRREVLCNFCHRNFL